MPRRFELGDLVTRCKQRAGKESDGSVEDDQWKFMISTAWAELYAEVAAAGLRYFETTHTITTTGAVSYTEPDDHLATVGVDRIIDAAGRRRPLRELMAQERHFYAGHTGEAVAWSLVDDQLILYPTPPAGQEYEWLYVPQPDILTDEADAYIVDVVSPDGEAFLLWAVAVQVLAAEESDTSLARAEREMARVRLVDWATLRNLNSSRRPVHGDEEPYGYPGDWYCGGGW